MWYGNKVWMNKMNGSTMGLSLLSCCKLTMALNLNKACRDAEFLSTYRGQYYQFYGVIQEWTLVMQHQFADSTTYCQQCSQEKKKKQW